MSARLVDLKRAVSLTALLLSSPVQAQSTLWDGGDPFRPSLGPPQTWPPLPTGRRDATPAPEQMDFGAPAQVDFSANAAPPRTSLGPDERMRARAAPASADRRADRPADEPASNRLGGIPGTDTVSARSDATPRRWASDDEDELERAPGQSREPPRTGSGSAGPISPR